MMNGSFAIWERVNVVAIYSLFGVLHLVGYAGPP